jgi:type IX secretion system PorP/SprF family membrane protein
MNSIKNKTYNYGKLMLYKALQKSSAVMLILFSLLFLGSFMPSTLFSQDIHFSQFNETPQLLNPGATGVNKGYMRSIINYKNQWSAMGNAFNTVAASFDMSAFDTKGKKAHLGAGVNFFSDKAGESKFGLTQINLCLAGIISVNDNSKFSLGLSLGAAQHKANLNTLTWGNQYDGTSFNTGINSNETTPVNSFLYADIGAGLYYEYLNGKATVTNNEQKRFSVGVAYFHLNRPEQKYFSTTENLLGKLVVNINGRYDISGSNISILPSAVYFMQGSSSELTAGCALRYRLKKASQVTSFNNESAITLGVHYRFKDAVIPQLYYEINSLSLGISYDINVSEYTKVSHYNGGVELSLKYRIRKGKGVGFLGTPQ